jgi:hypothetical protein
LLVAVASAPAAEETFDAVLHRAVTYGAAFRRELSSVVAEEAYSQTVRTAMGVTITIDGKGGQPTGHRELKSDILMVRTADAYTEFRDVFEVDGSSLRDRQNRLAELFVSSDKEAGVQIMRLNQESARYNIGNVYRNFNTPSLALMFLEPALQGRFSFTPTKSRTPSLATPKERGSASRFAVSDRLTVIAYKETMKHTIIRELGSLGDLPASGRFWLDPESGAVVMSELVIAAPLMRCIIDVAYIGAAGISVLVPAEMRERYVDNRDRVVTEGTATYSNLRRFQVNTTEVIPEVK